MIRAVFLLLLIPLCAAAERPVAFEDGQIWSYETRPENEGATIIIDAVRDDPAHAKAILITVVGLPCAFENCRPRSGRMSLVISEAALWASVRDFKSSDPRNVMADKSRIAEFRAGRLPVLNEPID